MVGNVGGDMIATGQMTIHVPDLDSLRMMSKFVLASAAGGAITGAVTSMIKAMWDKNSSAAWIAQLEKLATENSDGTFKYISDQLLTIGVPADKINEKNIATYGTVYLLAKNFDDIASESEHVLLYEIYVDPKNEELGDVFLHINNLLETHSDMRRLEGDKKLVSYLAIRPTPGMSKSRWNGKYLPRIIIGLNLNASLKDVRILVDELKLTLSQYDGIGYRPRYSEEIAGSNKLIYASKGSGDFKESAKGKMLYQGTKKSWLNWKTWLSDDVEDMAYPNESSRIGVAR
jgi:hypothetical protein